MRWKIRGELSLYESEWVRLSLADIDLPDGHHIKHHVVRMPKSSVGVVVRDPQRGFLCIWRHRFITDSWGWEIPSGHVDNDESPAEAGAREVLEETGWRPNALRPLIVTFASAGISDQRFSFYLSDGATYVGPPTEHNEADRVEWLSKEDLRKRMEDGEISDNLSLAALLWTLNME